MRVKIRLEFYGKPQDELEIKIIWSLGAFMPEGLCSCIIGRDHRDGTVIPQNSSVNFYDSCMTFISHLHSFISIHSHINYKF